MEDIKKAIEDAVDVVKNAKALVISAGAGIGVDSGLPDFRGNKGFWKAYPPIAKLGLSFSQMADPDWFVKRPKLAWAFYGHRLNLYRATQPHKGFYQLLEIGQEMQEGYFVYTSNVDGQFQKAGFAEENIKECHGSIHHFQCIDDCQGDIWNAKDEQVVVNETVFEAKDPLPKCPHCGALARPNILMFGDSHWSYDRTGDQNRRFEQFIYKVKAGRPPVAIIEMGAGKAIPTVRLNSEMLTQRLNATLIRINPRDYEVPQGHISIPLGAKEGVELIYSQL